MKNDVQEEFIQKYNGEVPMYREWGECVQKYIYENLASSEEEIYRIIKIEPVPRVKEITSMIEKAFFRKGKNYKNPYDEITDKVGVRFVVMVDKQITLIKTIIESAEIWDFSKDQDYEEARKNNPDLFGYESVHYIVRNRHNIDSNGICIKEGTPCEIQIRTLEQHAYAELSHDYVYKCKESIAPETKRFLARSMALNETTDELFSKVYDMMENENKKYYDLTKYLNSKIPFRSSNDKINKDIYDCIKPMIEKHNIEQSSINEFIKDYYLEKISKRNDKVIYRQPIIIMLYYLAENYPSELQEVWDFSQEMLVMIFSDLGIQSDDSY